MRLATIRGGGEEVAAVLVPGGAVPLSGLHRYPGDEGWPVDLLSLFESGRLDDLRSHVDGLGEADTERPSARVIPHGQVECGSLYGRPRKI